ncbi:MAG: DUF1838 family protein [Steroidobacteraceae bacterium]
MTTSMLLERRRLLCATAGLTGLALALPAAAKPVAPTLDLHDPQVALRSYVKLRGSLADETVFQPYEGDIVQVTDGAVPVPLCGFIGLQKSVWRRTGPDEWTNQDYDIGFYVDYETRQILDIWRNPVTGQTVKVYHYRGGPSGGRHQVAGPDGDVYGGRIGRWSVCGDQLWHTASLWGERPNPLHPREWPLASSGETLLGSMSLSFAGRLAEVADNDTPQVPALQIWTNTTGWMPWMEMGQRPGFNMWRWIGAKGTPASQLDPDLVAAAERVCPGYVARDAVWKTPTSGRIDYMRLRRGQSVTD